MGSRKDRMKLHDRDGVTVLDLGEVEIWDGADLSLLRETLTNLINVAGCRSIGVNMSYVKYIPSGFFGMLFDWHEQGVAMRLYSPQPHVARMLWFRQFFEPESDIQFVLQSEPKQSLILHDATESEWVEENGWEEVLEEPAVVAVARHS
jgi:hypothetical protein